MTVEEIEYKIKELDNLINRDASYQLPQYKLLGEQTLALYTLTLAVMKAIEPIKRIGDDTINSG